MTDDERFDYIMRMVRVWRQEGYVIRGHRWGLGPAPPGGFHMPSGPCVCPLGALLIGKRVVVDPRLDAALQLDTSPDWVLGFIQGFDRRCGKLSRNPERRAETMAGRVMGRQVAGALKEEVA
jgi:hypothetical protein